MMKRIKRASEPKHVRTVQPIAAEDLARVTGGATAIEYGLLVVAPIK
jgi:hypothetical protein